MKRTNGRISAEFVRQIVRQIEVMFVLGWNTRFGEIQQNFNENRSPVRNLQVWLTANSYPMEISVKNSVQISVEIWQPEILADEMFTHQYGEIANFTAHFKTNFTADFTANFTADFTLNIGSTEVMSGLWNLNRTIQIWREFGRTLVEIGGNS